VEPEPIQWRDDLDDVEGTECPVFIRQNYQEIFLAWDMLDKGVPPAAGGWAQQPYHWIQALQAIGPEIIRAERERIEAMRKRHEEND